LLHARKNPNQALNQRWTVTSEGYIALQNNPKLVLEIKSSAKDKEQIILSDSNSKAFKAHLAKWVILPIQKARSRGKYKYPLFFFDLDYFI